MIFSAMGWAGTALYLGNHAYLSFHPNHRPQIYFALNFIAAIALVVSSAVIDSWQAVATNAFWGVVSFFAFAHISFNVRFRLTEEWVIAPIGIAGVAGILYAFVDYEPGVTGLGWAAGALFCGAYLLFVTSTIARPRFLIYNIIAAAIIMPVLHLHGNWPVFALEAAWIAVSSLGWFQIRAASSAVKSASADVTH